MVFGSHAEWCLRQVTTDRGPRAASSQRTEGGQRNRGAVMCSSEQEAACGRGGHRWVQGHVDTAVVCALMTGCGWEEGAEGSTRGEEGRREAEGRQEGTQRRCLMGPARCQVSAD